MINITNVSHLKTYTNSLLLLKLINHAFTVQILYVYMFDVHINKCYYVHTCIYLKEEDLVKLRIVGFPLDLRLLGL